MPGSVHVLEQAQSQVVVPVVCREVARPSSAYMSWPIGANRFSGRRWGLGIAYVSHYEYPKHQHLGSILTLRLPQDEVVIFFSGCAGVDGGCGGQEFHRRPVIGDSGGAEREGEV
jgi:hypothetical protein